MKFKIVLIVFAGFFLLTNTTSASVIYSSEGGVTYSASDNIQNLPQLYSSLVEVYNQSYTDQNIMTQVSPGVWWISTGLIIPESAIKFYINSSTCSELRVGVNSRSGSIYGYPIIDNTKLVCWVDGAPADFNYSGRFEVVNNPFHDVTINNFQKIVCYNMSHKSFYNISVENMKYFFSFQPVVESCTINNVTIKNGDRVYGCGFRYVYANNCTFSNITTENIADYTNPSAASYAFAFNGCNNIVKDLYLNGSGWSTFLITIGRGYTPEEISDNNTVSNVTVLNAGHNGFEMQGDNSTIKNVSVYNSTLHNFFQVGTQEDYRQSRNNTYEHIYSYNPGSTSFKLSEGSDNITVKNSTFIGTGFSVDDCSNITIINCTQDGDAPNKPGNQFGYQASCFSGNFYYDCDQTLIDTTFQDNSYTDIVLVIVNNQRIINCYGNFLLYGNGYDRDVKRYYYPNLTVKNSQGSPVQNAVITTNTTSVNGFGKDQATFYTDSNGKLYDSGNRTNWLAIPDTYTDNSGEITYITAITATKNCTTDTEIVDPSSSWYSPDPSSLRGPEIVLTLDTDDSSVPGTNFT
jgi:hypothetical protein